MKTTTVLLALCAALFTGCATPNQCPPGDAACVEAERQKQLELWAADLRDIATIGVPLALADNPEAREAFQYAVIGLETLESSALPTLPDLLAVLREAGVKEIDSPKGQLYVAGGSIILRRLVGEMSVELPDEVRMFATALREGIEAGLE